MKLIDLDELNNDRNLWIVILGFMYFTGALQLSFGNFPLGVTTLGMAVTFSALGYQKINDKE